MTKFFFIFGIVRIVMEVIMAIRKHIKAQKRTHKEESYRGSYIITEQKGDTIVSTINIPLPKPLRLSRLRKEIVEPNINQNHYKFEYNIIPSGQAFVKYYINDIAIHEEYVNTRNTPFESFEAYVNHKLDGIKFQYEQRQPYRITCKLGISNPFTCGRKIIACTGCPNAEEI